MSIRNKIQQNKLYQKSRNFILYGGIGCITTALDIAIFMGLTQCGMKELIANTISYQTAMVVSFLLNRKYNFRVNDKFWLRFFSFFLINLIGYFTSQGLVYVFISVLSINDFIGKLLATILAGLIQFIFIKRITFRKKNRQNEYSKQSES